MKFKVQTLSNCTQQRLGNLIEIDGKASLTIPTPAVMIHTQGGQIPYVTHEIFKLVSKELQILQIPVASLHTFKETLQLYGDRITDFIGSKDSLSFITLQDPCDVVRQGHNSLNKVPIWTRNGKFYYDGNSYMDIIESCKPDMYCILSDGDTNCTSSEKRIVKSINNTKHFYRDCLERHRKSEILKNTFLIAPIVGGYRITSRQHFIDTILKDCNDINGFLIDGLHNNGPEIEFIDFNQVKPVIEAILNKLPEDRLRVIQGCWNPVNVINLIQLGIDLFDTTYCRILTERSAVMTFKIDPNDETTSNCSELNLNDAEYFDDFEPILIGCKCLTCTKYTRAYIHHLLTVHELLGPILIMIHNVFHYLRFFEKIRHCIKTNTLDALYVSILEQFPSSKHEKLVKSSV